MRLKTKLVLAITGLVFLMVCVLSWIFLAQLLEQRVSESYASNDVVAHEILLATQRSLETTAGDPGQYQRPGGSCGRRSPMPCAKTRRSPRS